ncbi:MAG: phosphonate ABC transporter, permease protein PhnE [Acidimicrobiia bacterium]
MTAIATRRRRALAGERGGVGGRGGLGGQAVRLSPPWSRSRVELTAAAVVFAVIAVWAIWRTQIWDVAAIFGEGRQAMADFLFGTALRDGALPPRFGDVGQLLDKVVETFFIAVAGTFIAAVLSLPLAFLAARSTTPNRVVWMVARGIIAFARTVPDVIFAFVFVRVYRIGPLPGMLAIGLHAIGMVGKLMADAIEQADPGPRQAVAAQGGSWLQQLSTGVLPQVVPSFLATVLFRLDINFRSSTVLGLVGAGGVGQLFMQYTGNLRWDLAMGVVAATVVTVLLVDQLSNRVRRALLGSAVGTAPPARGHRSVRPAQVLDPDRLVPPFDAYRRRLAMFAAGAAVLVVGSWWYTGVSLRNLLTGLRPQLGEPDAGQLPSVWYVARRLIPFDFATFTPKLDWWNSLVRTALFDTVATGFAAATIGILLALPLGYLAARTVAPNRVVYQAMRGLLVLIRAVPELVIAVVLVVALGLGLIPGVVALVIGVVGFGGKLFADAIEDVQPGPCEGVRSVGTSRVQEAMTAVTPQFVPALVGQGLYLLDICIRSSTVLGIVGAGGVGALLSNYLQASRFEEAGGILICVFAVVFAIERLSDWLRARLL